MRRVTPGAEPAPQVLSAGLRAVLVAVPALCAGVVVASSQQPWRQSGAVRLTGNQLTGGLVDGLGLLGLAGCGLLLVSGRMGRRLVGVLLVLVGLGVVAGVALDSQLSEAGWAAHGVPTGSHLATPLLAAGWLAAVAGAVMAAGGAVLAVVAGRWPARTSRFSRSRNATQDRAPVTAEDDPREVWAALDRGEDPTAENTRD